MLIQCTKKLLDKLGVEPVASIEEESLFCWHANYIRVNGKNTIVLLNNQTRYCITLYGVYAKDLKKLDELIKRTLKETMVTGSFNPEIIDAYIQAAGEVTYSKTSSRSVLSGLTNSSKYLEASIVYNRCQITNTALGNECSRTIVTIDGENQYPYEVFAKALESHFKMPAFKCRAAKLKIKLDLEETEVSRIIIIPLHKTIEDLHEAIQAVFSWFKRHAHQFVIYEDAGSDITGKFQKPVLEIFMDEEWLDLEGRVPVIVESGQKLNEFLPAEIKYIYDFGDYWEHYIETIEIIEDYDKPYPTLLEWTGLNVPKDVGGPGGYSDFLSVLANKKDPDHRELVQWGKMMGYGKFDEVFAKMALGWI